MLLFIQKFLLSPIMDLDTLQDFNDGIYYRT